MNTEININTDDVSGIRYFAGNYIAENGQTYFFTLIEQFDSYNPSQYDVEWLDNAPEAQEQVEERIIEQFTR